MKKPHLHKLPTYRHSITKQRAIVAPIWGTDKYTMDIYDYKSRYGREVFAGHKSTVMEFLKDMGFVV